MGSRFKVSFPAASNNLLNDETKIQVNESPEISSKEKIIKKVLILDDDEISLRTLSTFIKNEFEFDTVKEAKDAINFAMNNIYDAFLLDIGLKGELSGLDVAGELRKMKIYNKVPIIAVTAFAMAGDKERILEGGCSHYISKPCSKKDLLNTLKTALEENDSLSIREKRKTKELNQV